MIFLVVSLTYGTTKKYKQKLKYVIIVATFYGSDAEDEFHGGACDDILYDYGGSDYLTGGAGDDLLDGGDDRDGFVGAAEMT